MSEEQLHVGTERAGATSPLLRACRTYGDHRVQKVAVEFECADCCKKASNAKIADVVDGVLVLVACDDTLILVRTFSDGKVVDKQLAKVVIIPLDKVCSVELGAIDVDC